MKDWSHDHVLRALQGLPDPIGSLVRAFPGRAAAVDDAWLESWFVKLARSAAKGRTTAPDAIIASGVGDADISILSKQPVQQSVRILAIRPSYFRGFRAPAPTLSLDADLVVVEGRNSSGKTSLSEAIEWVLTGRLSRRDSGQHGHSSELADCIANQFRPAGAETFVELVLQVGDARQVVRRVLQKDYSRVAADNPTSQLLVDGKPLRPNQEDSFLNELFAGVHPILMQHNLRRFVHDEPHARRQYFERLLQIDELTALVEKAVIGPTRLKQIANPDGGTGLAALKTLVTELQRAGSADLAASMTKLERVKTANLPDQIDKGLLKVASTHFSKDAASATNIVQMRERVADAQRVDRESRLPLLATLTAARTHELPEWEPIAASLVAVRDQIAKIREVTAASAALSVAEREIARAAGFLADKGLLVMQASNDQLCPLCDDGRLTLSVARSATLANWRPLASAISEADALRAALATRSGEQLQLLRQSLALAIPTLPTRRDIDRQLKGANQRLASFAADAVSTAELLAAARAQLLTAVASLEARLSEKSSSAEQIEQATLAVQRTLSSVPGALTQHREIVSALDEAVGSASRDDVTYRLRDRWLELAGLTTALAEDLAWEVAKHSGKSALDAVRDGLINLRSRLIEHGRKKFSEDMTRMWHLLRSDSGAQFSRIFVPEARGKGYKLEFELKAVISDGVASPEVDALRVFSESQVNVVGLAAYITRARSLGHRVLIFDDPVQSMDEEHFRSFAGDLLPALLADGFQVVILTHSDTFARRLNEAHYQRESYVTLECRSGKRHGCSIDEGNRRVTERLKKAARKASDGELQEAWRLIRLAIERLYTLAFLRHTPGFDPDKWANMAADDMWNQGAGEIIENAVVGSGAKLKEILGLAVAGAHDKAASSETDIHTSIAFINTLLSPLRVGAG